MEDQDNEGEGSRSAAKDYNDRTKKFLAEADVEAKAREAADATDGSEGEELRRAEEEGRAKRVGNADVTREP
jgi:hypothetical protein